jgi:N-acyl homoserine lactone hydrolase
MSLEIVPINTGWLDNVERSAQQYLCGFGQKIRVCLTMWLILGGDEPILVDVGGGSPDTVAKHQNRELVQEVAPVQALAEHGVSPEDVRSIVLTHLHWDHCLGLESLAFPNADIYVQRRELQYAAAPFPPHRGFYNRTVLRKLIIGDEPGYPRIRVVDGDMKIADGVRMIDTPGHTPGLSAVIVNTSDRVYAIASDSVPLEDSWQGPTAEDWIPNGIHVDLSACYSSLGRLAREADVVLPSHSDSVFSQGPYPGPAQNTEVAL